MKLPQGRQVIIEVAGFMNWPEGQVFKHNAKNHQLVTKGDWTELTLELVLVPESTNYKVALGFVVSLVIVILPNPKMQFLKMGLYIEFIPRLFGMEYDNWFKTEGEEADPAPFVKVYTEEAM